MGRKSMWETHVLPYLEQIETWVQDISEAEISKRLGITEKTLNNYKNQHPELREALQRGRQSLILDLKASLKKKAKGFTYEESKTVIRDEGGKKVTVIEKYKKYAPPDTGAIHLLLKNYDPTWTNDDQTTIDLKQAQLDLARLKAEADAW